MEMSLKEAAKKGVLVVTRFFLGKKRIGSSGPTYSFLGSP